MIEHLKEDLERAIEFPLLNCIGGSASRKHLVVAREACA